MRKPSLKRRHAMDRQCERFNASHPIGSNIRYFPIVGRQDFKLLEIVEPGAYVAGAHTPVVQVAGGLGCVALSHVEDA